MNPLLVDLTKRVQNHTNHRGTGQIRSLGLDNISTHVSITVTSQSGQQHSEQQEDEQDAGIL